MLTRGAHDERAGDIYTAAGANVGEMGDDMGVRSISGAAKNVPSSWKYSVKE